MDIVFLKNKLLGCACIFPDGLSQLYKIGGLHRQEKTASWEVFFPNLKTLKAQDEILGNVLDTVA